MLVNHRTCRTLFFAGTDTNVGKTYVAALAAKSLQRAGHRVGVYKPIASGCQAEADKLVADDALELWTAAGKPRCLDDVCPQRFIAPLAPPEAAALEGREIDSTLLREGARCWEEVSDLLIVEGAGGLFSPLAGGVLNIDLVQQFAGSRLIIIAADRLGVIHQTLATCEAAVHRGARPFGIFLCRTSEQADPSSATNIRQITDHSDVPVLGRVAFAAKQMEQAIAKHLIQ